jgi:ubiquinone biosynthesis protein
METPSNFNLNDPLLSPESLGRLWDGRSRTTRAVTTVLKIEATYRRLREELGKGSYSREEKRVKYRKLHEINAKRLYKLCKKNGATWTKFGQFLSARPDLLPREYIKALEPLQNDTPEVSFEELIPVLESELGENWESKFEWIEEEPIATASIGQVHKAKLSTGEEIAVKIQLPQVRKLFRQDVILFRTLTKILEGRVPHIDIIPIINHLLAAVAEELDFTIEAGNILEMHKHKHIDRIRLPELLPEISTERVICTYWIEGLRLIPFIDSQDKEGKKDILNLIQNSFMQQVTEFGIFQNDPHPGNFLVDEEKNLYVLDFGTVGRLSNEEKMHLTMLLFSLLNRNKDGNLAELLANAGFKGITEETIKEVNQLAKKYKNAKKMPPIDDVIEELLETLRENKIGVPEYFVSVGRTISTLSGLMTRYKIRFDFLPQNPLGSK